MDDDTMLSEAEATRLTQEALDDVDQGRVVDHAAVQTWADSLGTDRVRWPQQSPVVKG
jgi:hypothetical protein